MRSFGCNINRALRNPSEFGENSSRTLIREVMHDLRNIGCSHARWLPKFIWHNWESAAGADPENQSTGEIDPQWFRVTALLLDEAERFGLNVTVVLCDLATGMNTLPNGYYGNTTPSALFGDPAALGKLSARFVKMVNHLSQFNSLYSVELLNEPAFGLLSTSSYWGSIGSFFDALGSDVRRNSGTCYWNDSIVQAAKAGGVFSREDYHTLHIYQTFARSAAESKTALDTNAGLAALRLGGATDIKCGEIGSSDATLTLSQNADMTRAVVEFYKNNADVSAWVWGTWFDPTSSNYRAVFNPRAASGAAFAPFISNTGKNIVYSVGQNTDGYVVTTGIVSNDDPNSNYRGKNFVLLGNVRYVGFDSVGIVPKTSSAGPLTPPKFLLFTSDSSEYWLSAQSNAEGAYMDLYRANADGASPTPLELVAPANDSSAPRSQFVVARADYQRRIAL